MPRKEVDVVITGVGVVSPIGIGADAALESLLAGKSGIGPLTCFDAQGLPVRVAGEVRGFDPKAFVPRKSLKVMARDSQLGVAASVLACKDARIEAGAIDPDRFGVVLGADAICNPVEESEVPYRRAMASGRFEFNTWAREGVSAAFPLSFLRVLPNMIASHISIVHDARGPNNTIHQAEVSGQLALSEAARVIQRGAADVMIAGGASSQMNPFDWVRHCLIERLSPRSGDPASIARPFDSARDGQVWGEGAAALILESRPHAEARGASIVASMAGLAARCERPSGRPLRGDALREAMRQALAEARLEPRGLGHVNAHGLSTLVDDRIEASVIREVAGDIPVTAPKSYFGNLGAAAGAMEMAASLLAFRASVVPPTLNYERPDPLCPIEVVSRAPLGGTAKTALVINWSAVGQATATVLIGEG